jgi:hypothetical protein
MKHSLLTALLAVAPLGVAGAQGGTGWTVLAWNDQGVHSMDADYSVFSLHPPFNTLQAQLLNPDGEVVGPETGFVVCYRAVADPDGSINTISVGKTEFWTYAPELYGCSELPGEGLAGFDMPGRSNEPQPMEWDSSRQLWYAQGIPITPYDDQGKKRYYPLFEVIAHDPIGAQVAQSPVVIPVSDEMDCRGCHASGVGDAAKPAAGWAFDLSNERDYRLNILKLHDESHLGEMLYDAALVATEYGSAGLFAAATVDEKPVLCARCHQSNFMPGTGLWFISQLSIALHHEHADVIDPKTGLTLDDVDNRKACYQCHPGSQTRYLRGSMGSAAALDGDLKMQCQDCHGTMSAVGAHGREGWLDEPNCQACHTGTAIHNNGQIRYTSAFEPDGTMRVAVDQTFATDPDVPAPGYSLYRYSDGHGGLACEACHGATHAIYPGVYPLDNEQSIRLQGHKGTIVECSACHEESPDTVTGGPHGMHPVGAPWVEVHGPIAKADAEQCKTCHANWWKGSVLSVLHDDRWLPTEIGKEKLWFRGSKVSCWGCHDGPTTSAPSPNHAPWTDDVGITVLDEPVSVELDALDPDGDPLVLRIVDQPGHGRVGFDGMVATYHPDPWFAGTDTFTFSAWDGKLDGNLGQVTVTRLASWSNFGFGVPGTGGVVPAFVADAPPALGTHIRLMVSNPLGEPTAGLVVSSDEYATYDVGYGAMLWVMPVHLYPMVIQEGGVTLDWDVPSKPMLVGTTQHAQALMIDPGAGWGLAFSPALRLTLGY